jgi:PAS domain S-box-containing protein
VTELDFQTFEAVGALVVVLDVEGRIVYWNRACSDLTGYAVEEVRGRPLWDFALVPEEIAPTKTVFAASLTSDPPSPYANYWVTKLGERRWVAWSHSATRTPDGQVQYVIKTGIDRSERKEAEDNRRANEATLGALAVENARLYESARRSADDLLEANQHMVQTTIEAQELTEKVEVALHRAEASERRLQAVAEFREMFIGVLGHDLRTPISAIRMSADALLLHGRLDERDSRTAERIVNACERATRMIFQLLELTRARLGGGFPLEPKPTDLREVCRSVADELGPAVRLEVEGNLTGVWDPDRLAEAISNIARNATEHAAPETGVVVKARPEGTEVVVEIINQGEPIPADVLPFIFEPFRRAPRQRKSATGNLGLGLYIANQIVGSGGGKLVAYSADGTTTFLMRLPRQPPADAHGQSGASSDRDDHPVPLE